MRTYEALYIVRPEVDDEQIQTIAKEVEDMVTANGGTIVRMEIWGKRKMAYEVQKCTEGNYILLRFESNPAFIARLENYFRLSDLIIRYLVTYFDAHTLRLEAEQIRRKEEEARNNAEGRGRRSDKDDDDDDSEEYSGRRPSRGRRRYDDDDDDE
jgi:small subunit ribosomal protein S6